MLVKKKKMCYNVSKLREKEQGTICTAPQKLDRKNLTFGVFYYEIEL